MTLEVATLEVVFASASGGHVNLATNQRSNSEPLSCPSLERQEERFDYSNGRFHRLFQRGCQSGPCTGHLLRTLGHVTFVLHLFVGGKACPTYNQHRVKKPMRPFTLNSHNNYDRDRARYRRSSVFSRNAIFNYERAQKPYPTENNCALPML